MDECILLIASCNNPGQMELEKDKEGSFYKFEVLISDLLHGKAKNFTVLFLLFIFLKNIFY